MGQVHQTLPGSHVQPPYQASSYVDHSISSGTQVSSVSLETLYNATVQSKQVCALYFAPT